MNPNRTRLFVIIDPENDHQVALLKALLIAKLGKCHIHAFMCVYADLDEHGEASSRRDLKFDTVKLAKVRLEKYLQACEQSNIPFTSEVVWTRNWYEAALQAIAKSGCDLVIKSSFHHARARRFSKNIGLQPDALLTDTGVFHPPGAAMAKRQDSCLHRSRVHRFAPPQAE